MKARRQLLMWNLVIFVLSLVLFDRLLDKPVMTGEVANQPQSESFEFAGLVWESELLTSDEGPSDTHHFYGPPINAGRTAEKGEYKLTGSQTIWIDTYEVRQNDTLSGIANRYHLDLETLMRANGLKNAHMIRNKQILKIPTQRGVLHTIENNETLGDIALRYNVPMKNLIHTNAITNPNLIRADTILFIPTEEKY